VTLLAIEGKKILIDPGVNWWEKDILTIFPRIDEIWLTHAHPDHAAIAGRLQSRLGCRVVCSEEDKEIIQHPGIFMEKEFEAAGQFKNDIFPRFLRPFDGFIRRIAYGKWPPARVEATFNELDKSLYGVQVIKLPGHTHGSVGFYVVSDKVLIIGDLIQKRLGDPVISMNLPQADLDEAFSSLEKILELNPDVIISAHGEEMRGPEHISETIQETKGKYQRYRAEVLSYLKNKKRIPSLSAIEEEVPFDWPPHYTAMFFEKRSLVLTILKSLYRSGELDPSFEGVERIKSVLN